MKYRNVKTGIEIEVLSECGGDWVLVEEPKKKGGGKKDTAEKVDESGESAESADSSEDVKESDE